MHFDDRSRLARVKIKSPSFSNWRVFPFTVHGSNMMDYAINEASFGLTIAHGPEYFIHRLRFTHDVAPIFGPYLFAPAIRTVYYLAQKLRALQSGHLNFHLALIGGLLVIILALTLP